MQKIGFYCQLFILIGLFSSCDKTPNITPNSYVPIDSMAHGIFVCNEGNFQWANASLGFYNTNTGSMQDDIFKSNNQRSLGDVLQSICLLQNKVYLVVNNSQKIEVVDSKTFKSTATISGFNSPRYMLPISDQKAYVSDLYEKAIWIVDLLQQKISGKIAIPSWTEEMVVSGNKAFICGRSSSFVYVVNTQTDALMDSIAIGYGAQNMLTDKEGKIWVLCVGQNPIPAQLHCIHPSTGIEKSFSLPAGSNPSHLVCNTAKTIIYWINTDIYAMAIYANQLPTKALVAAAGRNFYGLGFNGIQSEILASDAKDYVQKSEVYRFDTLGLNLGSFKAGTNANYFLAR